MKILSSLTAFKKLSRLFMTAAASIFLFTATQAQTASVVISQVYGGGGNSGATYTHDFIELFNGTSSPVGLNGWSVQYASATGTSWTVTTLPNITLNPGQYFLIRQAVGSGGTTALPTPDAIGTIAMSATAGKVALVNSVTALSGSCPTIGVVDIVGFGTTANCFEGSGPTPAPSNTNAVIRASAGCTDSNSNSSDFSAGLPNPRNTSSPLNPCTAPCTAPAFTSCPAPISTSTGTLACNAVVNYTATASGTGPVSYSYSFSGATTATGSGNGSGSTFATGVTNVTVTATNSCGSATCSFTVTVTDNTPPSAACQNITVNLDAFGNASITPAQVNNGSSDNCGTVNLVSVVPNTFTCSNLSLAAPAGDLFISEYIEGSSNNKCIEIFNGTGAPVNLATGNYQLLFYFNGSASAGLTINLTGTVAAGDVYVVCQSSSAAQFLAQADQTNGSGWYNGDDAVVLRKGGSTVLDIIGRIGEDPGAEWGTGLNSTADNTIIRNSNIAAGVTVNPASGFPTLATEWTGFATDFSTNLGSHSFTAPPAPTGTSTPVSSIL
jgi:predicted extracellular nuclease